MEDLPVFILEKPYLSRLAKSAQIMASKNYLDELNDVQRQAVTATEGPVLVVAGPGSGKTRVLTYRIAHLIELGVAPWEILSLTFTNKAAREMKERIEKVVGTKAKSVWAGTFHSIFAKILRFEAEKIGYSSNFTIYDSDDSKTLVTALIKELNLDKNVYNPNAVRARISSAKSNLISPKSYLENVELMEEDRVNRRPHFHKLYENYVARCKRAGAMDFDDLLYRFYELLQANPDNVREKYQSKFRYLLVDEFQDTNFLQYAIIRKLSIFDGSQKNICVVGDDAQSIYGFRGATIQNILDFESDFKNDNIRVFKLEQNYRSTEHIVQAANEVIVHNRRQIQKTIRSEKGIGQKIRVVKAMTDSEEGKRVADAIVEQKNRWHLGNRDIAILYRTNAQSRVFEENLRRYNIPYRVFGGLSFYQRKEVKDLIAYLRLAVNPRDEEALRRVINYPRRSIGDSTVEKAGKLASDTQRTMWDCLEEVDSNTRAQNALFQFKEMIKDFGKLAETKNAYEVANYVARKSGLMDLLKQDTTLEGLSRLENINALLDGINSFVENDLFVEGEETADKLLASYLQNIALLTDQDENTADGDYVTLMSVHSAKGLEFKSVFVVGLEENLFPSFLSLDSAEGIDEERRLFYVAITRAEQYLSLSYAVSRYQYGDVRYNAASRFLEEITLEHLDSNSPMGGQMRSPLGRMESWLGVNEKASAKPTGASVTGFFRKPSAVAKPVLTIDPANFKASPSEQIQTGMKVLHLKFGEGKVIDIDGGRDNRVATIAFDGDEIAQRRILLKFAKLQILN